MRVEDPFLNFAVDPRLSVCIICKSYYLFQGISYFPFFYVRFVSIFQLISSIGDILSSLDKCRFHLADTVDGRPSIHT